MYTRTVDIIRHSPAGEWIGLANLTCTFHQEVENWVGVCQELGTSSYGDSLKEANEQLAEAILLQLTEVTRLGYVDQFLKERNVRLSPIPSPTNQYGWTLAGAGI